MLAALFQFCSLPAGTMNHQRLKQVQGRTREGDESLVFFSSPPPFSPGRIYALLRKMFIKLDETHHGGRQF